MEGIHVVVIGAGPGGLLSAAQFAALGARVTVYERSTLKEQTRLQVGWTIALGKVAKDAIEGAGVSADFGRSAKIEGASSQRGLAEPRFLGKWAPKQGGKGASSLLKSLAAFECFTTRQLITQHLRKEIEEKLQEHVTFCDGMMLVGGDLPKGEVVLQKSTPCTETGNGSASHESAEVSRRVTVQADIVIGADGAGSKTRRILQELDSGFTSERRMAHVSNLPFELSIPQAEQDRSKLLAATPSGKPFLMAPSTFEVSTDGGAFISFQGPSKSASPAIMRVLTLHFRNGGTEGSGMMTCSKTWWEKQDNEDDLLEVLKACFPQIPIAWLESCASAAVASKDYGFRTSSFVKCSKLGSGRCVLIGDAAHAVSPNIAAGATNALHDASLLAPCALDLVMLPSSIPPLQSFQSSKNFKDVVLGSLNKSSTETNTFGFDRFESIAAEWTTLRLQDAHALSNMSEQLNNGILWSVHRNWSLFFCALPIYIPWGLSTTSIPGKGWLVPFSPQDALINGGAGPAEIEHTLHRSFFKLATVTGVACAVTVGLGVHLSRSKLPQ